MKIKVLDLNERGVGIGIDLNNTNSEHKINVSYAIEGEILVASIHKNYDHYSDADFENVLIASKDRVIPKCKYFSKCGGCQFQHISLEKQREWKKKQIINLFSSIKTDVNEIVGSNESYNYR